MSTALSGANAGIIKGDNVDWATSGWFSPDQGKTNQSQGRYELVGTAKTDPQQSLIRSTYALAKLKTGARRITAESHMFDMVRFGLQYCDYHGTAG